MKASAQLNTWITLFPVSKFCIVDRVAASAVWKWWRQTILLAFSNIEPDYPASYQSLPFLTELAH